MDNREIDKLIAEKVMELELHFLEPLGGFHTKEVEPDGYWRWVELPHYSTDIAAAWQVVEKMRSSGWRFEAFDTIRDSWLVRFGKGEFNHYENEWSKEHISDENSCTLAICLAALKAVGVEVSECPRMSG